MQGDTGPQGEAGATGRKGEAVSHSRTLSLLLDGLSRTVINIIVILRMTIVLYHQCQENTLPSALTPASSCGVHQHQTLLYFNQ